MYLQPKEAKKFFKIWLGLLAFVNDKYKLVKDFGHPKDSTKTKIKPVFEIKTKLWENTGIIDEYIDSVWDLPREEIKILKGWKSKIEGTFIIVRHLKKYSVFLDGKKELLYGVLGITYPISRMYPNNTLPKMVETVLLPFNNQIIYDGMFCSYNFHFGPNMRKDLKDLYMEIKKERGIISTLE